MSDYNRVSSVWQSVAIGAIAGWTTLMGMNIYDRINSKQIPKVEQVQQGCIAPSKLEIECKDLDGNGEPETIMKIGNKPYLLREVDGKPVISAYEIRPAEVVPKSKYIFRSIIFIFQQFR